MATACKVQPRIMAADPEVVPAAPLCIVTGALPALGCVRCRARGALIRTRTRGTGANTGIGKGAAARIVARGFSVIMACRSVDKAQAAMESIKARVGAETGRRLSVMCLDLASQASVRQFAATFLAQSRPLHVLVLNAGFIESLGTAKRATREGLDLTMGVNHAGHMLLTALLLPALVRGGTVPRPPHAGPARVVSVASIVHSTGHITFADNMWQPANGRNAQQLYSVRARVCLPRTVLRCMLQHGVCLGEQLRRRVGPCRYVLVHASARSGVSLRAAAWASAISGMTHDRLPQRRRCCYCCCFVLTRTGLEAGQRAVRVRAAEACSGRGPPHHGQRAAPGLHPWLWVLEVHELLREVLHHQVLLRRRVPPVWCHAECRQWRKV